MNVLIVGYGKIGQVKAELWKRISANVYVYDNDPKRSALVTQNGHKLFNGGQRLNKPIVDISTPAGSHAAVLEWVLLNVCDEPTQIIIEKPIASSRAELSRLKQILGSHPHIKNLIEVNETYYYSSALKHVIDKIKSEQLKIESITINLSKNRLPDVLDGRFVDSELGAFGIETPHMLAILQRLGITLESLEAKSIELSQDVANENNEGFNCGFMAGNIKVCLRSYLGSYTMDREGQLVENSSIKRYAEIITDKDAFLVEFDPSPGLDRFKSRITRCDEKGRCTVEVIEDDHLYERLKNSYKHDDMSAFVGFDNASKIAQFIIEMRRTAQIKRIKTLLIDESNVSDSTVNEGVVVWL